MNIFEMYIANGCKLDFYVHKNSWAPHRKAKVVNIEGVLEGAMPEGDPPYFNGSVYPKGHPKVGKTIYKRKITMHADWFDGGPRSLGQYSHGR